MEQEKFLKRETKVFAVVTSVLLGLALLILVVIGLIGGNFLSISVVGSSVVLFVSAIFMGSMQIRVFSNYKSQKKYLCADGIFYICLTSLVAITSMIFVFIPNARFDVRYFIFVFAIAFAVWKILISVLGFKNKHFNAFLELIIAILWLLSGVGVLLSTFVDLSEIGQYVLCASNYLLGAVTLFYILFSYVFKEPDFLITEKAKEILNKEIEERQQRINRFNNKFIIQNNVDESKNSETLEEKLKKLQALKDKNFITEEEFEKRKQKLIDEEI